MRLLILGGTGSTGKALIAQLQSTAAPAGITVISRTARELAGAQRVLTGHFADIVAAPSFRDELAGFDAIVHLADGLAALQSGVSDKREADRLIAATNRAAMAAREARVAAFIHVSSIKAICGEDDDRVLTETCAPRPTGLYGQSKLRLEQVLHGVFDGSATRLIILRNPVMYAEDKAGSIHRLLELADTGWPLPLGGLRNKRSLVAVDNFASALAAVVRAGGHAPAGVFHVHDGPPLSTSDMVRIMRSALGRPQRLFPIGPLTVLARHMPVAGATARRLYGSLQLSDAKFRQSFDWSPVTETQAGLAAMAARRRAGRRRMRGV